MDGYGLRFGWIFQGIDYFIARRMGYRIHLICETTTFLSRFIELVLQNNVLKIVCVENNVIKLREYNNVISLMDVMC